MSVTHLHSQPCYGQSNDKQTFHEKEAAWLQLKQSAAWLYRAADQSMEGSAFQFEVANEDPDIVNFLSLVGRHSGDN